MILIKRFWLLLLYCISASATICAQDTPKCGRFYLESSLGGMIHTSSVQSISPWLSLDDAHKFDLDMTFGAKYFWSKGWGVQVQLLLNTNSGQEYLYDGRLFENNRVEVSKANIQGNASVGIIYRHFIRKWEIQPYCNAGITGLSGSGFMSYIKHSGSNDVDNFAFKFDRENHTVFSITPGLQLNYYLQKFLYLYAGASYMINPGSYNGGYTLHNLYTQELKEQQRIKTKFGDALLINFGIGFKLF